MKVFTNSMNFLKFQYFFQIQRTFFHNSMNSFSHIMVFFKLIKKLNLWTFKKNILTFVQINELFQNSWFMFRFSWNPWTSLKFNGFFKSMNCFQIHKFFRSILVFKVNQSLVWTLDSDGIKREKGVSERTGGEREQLASWAGSRETATSAPT